MAVCAHQLEVYSQDYAINSEDFKDVLTQNFRISTLNYPGTAFESAVRKLFMCKTLHTREMLPIVYLIDLASSNLK